MEEGAITKGDTTKKYILLFCAEFFGTAILMYIGCLGTILPVYEGMQPIIVSVTFGTGILAAVLAFGYISGPHLNPCITLGIFILGKIHWKRMLVYFAAQYTGAFFGYALMWFEMPAHSADMKPCALTVYPFLTPARVFFLEIGASFVLFMVVAGVVEDKNTKWGDTVALKFGLILFGIMIAFVAVTGASLNSARAIPSAVFNNVWDGHWAFHLGPYIGMILASVLYRFMFDTGAKYSLNRSDEIM